MQEDGQAFSVDYYDPLSTRVLTQTILGRFERQRLHHLGDGPPEFDGSGLYAIYYDGDSVELYLPLVGTAVPAYVGQARSHNSATGRSIAGPRPLWTRVREHRRSIDGGGLPLEEFGVRLLRMPDVHIDLGENGLRFGYQPVWNSVLKGLGSHEQGSTTRQSGRGRWDTVHSGRNRTFGVTAHDADKLKDEVRRHIDRQVAEWHKRDVGA